MTDVFQNIIVCLYELQFVKFDLGRGNANEQAVYRALESYVEISKRF